MDSRKAADAEEEFEIGIVGNQEAFAKTDFRMGPEAACFPPAETLAKAGDSWSAEEGVAAAPSGAEDSRRRRFHLATGQGVSKEGLWLELEA